MAAFPRLKTGAVLQYPATRGTQFPAPAVRFVDGSEQRYRERSSRLRRWEIRLDLLEESELAALEEFFLDHQGEAGSFSFTDPWDGAEHADCSLDQDSLALVFHGEMRGAASLVVQENRN